MPKTTIAQLTRLKEQRDKLEARIQAAEARAKLDERKKDTRRKILVGSYYLEQAAKRQTWDELRTAMDNFLTRDSDRKLFELPLREKDS